MNKQPRAVKFNDPRTPTSITRKGAFTVRVYDEAAYRANIAQYYQDDSETPAPTSAPRKYTPFVKRKPSARYNWAGKLGA